MLRFLLGALVGLTVGLIVAAATGVHAESEVSPYSARADCIVSYESHWDPSAVNRRTGAAGLGQFLYGTWLTTPYANRSRLDPWANHAAVCYMLEAGRAREFDVVKLGLC